MSDYFTRKVFRQVSAAWEGDFSDVHLSMFSDREWETSKRAKRLRAEHAGEFLRVRQATSEHLVFTREPTELSEPVAGSFGAALARAFLSAPVKGRRWALPKVTADPEVAQLAEAAEATSFSSLIPHDLSLDEEVALVSAIAGGDPWELQDGDVLTGKLTTAEKLAAYREVQARWRAERLSKRNADRENKAFMQQFGSELS